MSPDDSQFEPVISEEESPEVSLTDFARVERADDIEETESVRAGEEEPEIGAESGDVPVMATVDLDQLFSRMERHLERQVHTLTGRPEAREELIENPVLKVLKEF